MTRPRINTAGRRSFERSSPTATPSDSRRGFTIVELTIAIMLVAVCWGLVAPMLVQLGRQRREVGREQRALLLASNVIDELSQCALEDLPLKRAALQQQTQQRMADDYPGVEVILKEMPMPNDVPGRSVTCQIRWYDDRGQPAGSVALTGWNIPPSGGAL